MNSVEKEFTQALRAFAVRYISFLREKSYSAVQIEDWEVFFSRAISQPQEKHVVLQRVLAVELKTDYHQVIALTLLQDLAKWSRENHSSSGQSSKETAECQESIKECAISLLNSQQQFHTIVPKQNELLRELLLMPSTIQDSDRFKVFYRKLKDIKEFYPSTVRESQKVTFLRTIEDSIDIACDCQSLKTVEFVFNNIFAELQFLPHDHEFTTSRLKIIRRIVKRLQSFHEEIVYKAAYLVVRFSDKVLQLPHLFNSVVCLYEELQPRLLNRPSMASLYVFEHLVLNNIKKIASQDTQHANFKGKNYLALEVLLGLALQAFTEQSLPYFMAHYDCNPMEESVCHQTLELLFEFVENRANERKYEFEVFKRHLKEALGLIRGYLHRHESAVEQFPDKAQLYQVKKKEYSQIVSDMNQTPKKLFKKLESITNAEIKEQIAKKYVRIARKSCHLEIKAMINLFAADNAASDLLFGEYVRSIMGNLRKGADCEEFLRYFSSNFFLSGEGQQILRVLDRITQLYFQHQPPESKVFQNSDSVYTFANAIILLNTDLHNPKNEEKISEEAFLKMCKKINNGSDLPREMVLKVYHSIRKNKINTFRSRNDILGISPENFLLLCSDRSSCLLEFYDQEMQIFDSKFMQSLMYSSLLSVVDERESLKLNSLIEAFRYQDDTYECEVLELVRRLSQTKHHIALAALEKVFEVANFKNAYAVEEKHLSYLWLSCNLIENFSDLLPTNVICELLLLSWDIRQKVRDNMFLRERAEFKRTKRLIRELQKRESKKSIMDMFSSFLSKDSASEGEGHSEELYLSPKARKMNYKGLTEKVMGVLLREESGGDPNQRFHREKAIEFFIRHLKSDQQKLFEEFLSILYTIFHLIYGLGPSSWLERSAHEPQNTNHSQYEFSKNAQCCEEMVEDFFYELLGLKESSITQRIHSLKSKDLKKYTLLMTYSEFWLLKILLKENSIFAARKNISVDPNRFYLLDKAIEFLNKADLDSFQDLLYELEVGFKKIGCDCAQSDGASNSTSEPSTQSLDAAPPILKFAKVFKAFYLNGVRLMAQGSEAQFQKLKELEWLINLKKKSELTAPISQNQSPKVIRDESDRTSLKGADTSRFESMVQNGDQQKEFTQEEETCDKSPEANPIRAMDPQMNTVKPKVAQESEVQQQKQEQYMEDAVQSSPTPKIQSQSAQQGSSSEQKISVMVPSRSQTELEGEHSMPEQHHLNAEGSQAQLSKRENSRRSGVGHTSFSDQHSEEAVSGSRQNSQQTERQSSNQNPLSLESKEADELVPKELTEEEEGEMVGMPVYML